MVFWGMDHDRDIPLHDAVYTSCAIPGIFPPQKIGEEFYFDGGVVDSLPLELARIRKPDRIIAVKLASLNHVNGHEIQKGGILSIMERFYDIKNRELSKDRRRYQTDAPLILIEPEVADHRLFKIYRTPELIQKGEAKALAVLRSYPSGNQEKGEEMETDGAAQLAPSLSVTG
jgi:NTE family protein